MNEVNKTLFIPLYGKSKVSKQGIIIKDPDAERIWDMEGFPVKGKSASKWLAYNMAMRASVFDDWTRNMLKQDPGALILHVGCGLDSRCNRVGHEYRLWVDCDFPDVLAIRSKYYTETDKYRMMPLDASKPEQISSLPDSNATILILEGICMYLTKEQINAFLRTMKEKYSVLYVLMDVYTELGAKASKYKNPVNDVGVTTVYGIDKIGDIIEGTCLHLKTEHSFTPDHLVVELKASDRRIFRFLFTGRAYKKIYRLYELT